MNLFTRRAFLTALTAVCAVLLSVCGRTPESLGSGGAITLEEIKVIYSGKIVFLPDDELPIFEEIKSNTSIKAIFSDGKEEILKSDDKTVYISPMDGSLNSIGGKSELDPNPGVKTFIAAATINRMTASARFELIVAGVYTGNEKISCAEIKSPPSGKIPYNFDAVIQDFLPLNNLSDPFWEDFIVLAYSGENKTGTPYVTPHSFLNKQIKTGEPPLAVDENVLFSQAGYGETAYLTLDAQIVTGIDAGSCKVPVFVNNTKFLHPAHGAGYDYSEPSASGGEIQRGPKKAYGGLSYAGDPGVIWVRAGEAQSVIDEDAHTINFEYCTVTENEQVFEPLTPPSTNTYNAAVKAISSPEDLAAVPPGVKGVYIMLEDVELPEIAWNPVGGAAGEFQGWFYGNGKTISGLSLQTVSNSANKGLFSVIRNARIENLNLELKNFKIENGSYNENLFSAGALAAKAYSSTIENINISTDLSVLNIEIKAGSFGGLAGEIYNSTVSGCVQQAPFSILAGGTGSVYCGGLIGKAGLDSLIKDCLVESPVKVESRASAAATPFIAAGGIAGEINGSEISKCGWRGESGGGFEAYFTGASVYSLPALFAGGIAGIAGETAVITECAAKGKMFLDSAGQVYKTPPAEGAAYNGVAAGGLAGLSRGNINQSYSAVDINSVNSGVYRIGGAAGWLDGPENAAEIKFSYASGSVKVSAKNEYNAPSASLSAAGGIAGAVSKNTDVIFLAVAAQKQGAGGTPAIDVSQAAAVGGQASPRRIAAKILSNAGGISGISSNYAEDTMTLSPEYEIENGGSSLDGESISNLTSTATWEAIAGSGWENFSGIWDAAGGKLPVLKWETGNR
ncbi:MAG: hypothetical protein LBC53_01405 [Spirochaetaceae bacterium]|jgi:hypothetical protein|nr:hypothetical protein [Spirochaetaceae bacterium]